ncbi:hypothetical protein GCM10009738_48920 [Kitasatospora viridis]
MRGARAAGATGRGTGVAVGVGLRTGGFRHDSLSPEAQADGPTDQAGRASLPDFGGAAATARETDSGVTPEGVFGLGCSPYRVARGSLGAQGTRPVRPPVLLDRYCAPGLRSWNQ